MPFDEENEDSQIKNPKIGLKNVSSQKSIFENIPKKPNPEDFEKKIKESQEKNTLYKQKVAELAVQFKKIIDDKTLIQNKNIFAQELEKEVLGKMIQLAVDINNDPNEQEGMGSLGWITLILKVMLHQRDKINNLDYKLTALESKYDSLYAQIVKELQTIDKKKTNE